MDKGTKCSGRDLTVESLADAEHARRDEAFARAWAWYGGPDPTPEQEAAIDRELGWTTPAATPSD